MDIKEFEKELRDLNFSEKLIKREIYLKKQEINKNK